MIKHYDLQDRMVQRLIGYPIIGYEVLYTSEDVLRGRAPLDVHLDEVNKIRDRCRMHGLPIEFMAGYDAHHPVRATTIRFYLNERDMVKLALMHDTCAVSNHDTVLIAYRILQIIIQQYIYDQLERYRTGHNQKEREEYLDWAPKWLRTSQMSDSAVALNIRNILNQGRGSVSYIESRMVWKTFVTVTNGQVPWDVFYYAPMCSLMPQYTNNHSYATVVNINPTIGPNELVIYYDSSQA